MSAAGSSFARNPTSSGALSSFERPSLTSPRSVLAMELARITLPECVGISEVDGAMSGLFSCRVDRAGHSLRDVDYASKCFFSGVVVTESHHMRTHSTPPPEPLPWSGNVDVMDERWRMLTCVFNCILSSALLSRFNTLDASIQIHLYNPPPISPQPRSPLQNNDIVQNVLDEHHRARPRFRPRPVGKGCCSCRSCHTSTIRSV